MHAQPKRMVPTSAFLLAVLLPVTAAAQGEAPAEDAGAPAETDPGPVESAPGEEIAEGSGEEASAEAEETPGTEAEADETATEDETPDEIALSAQPDEVVEEVPAEAGTGEDGLVLYGAGSGEYGLRVNLMNQIPLMPLPRTDPAETGSLGQTMWAEQWIRLRAEMGLRSRLRLVGELDIFDGLVFGDFAQGIEAAEHPRDDATAFPGVQPRALYVEAMMPPVGMLRAGLMTSHWGLGILANDGAHEPVFGAYRYGDVVTRVAFATKPLGMTSPYTVVAAGDLVFDDGLADIRDGDIALQGVLAAYYEQDERTVGFYAVYRSQRTTHQSDLASFDDGLDVVVLDAFARWDMEEPSGGTLFGAVEAAYVHGQATLARTLTVPEHDIRQLMVVGQVGRTVAALDVILEGGYTTGDSNTEDDQLLRASLDPDHRVGLILFPEVLAWQTARAATLAQSEILAARPSPGSELLPTNGGVAGAFYLFPHAMWRIRKWIEARVGMVWGRATADVVDPYRQRAESRTVNYRGGDSRNRDLGLELDASVILRTELSRSVAVSGGIEAGVFLPGHAFDDEAGETMDPVGLLVFRGGLSF